MTYGDLTVVLPTLNEAGNIGSLIDTLERVLPDVSILVVDDGSKDGTGDVVRQRRSNKVRLIERVGKPCLTESISEGIRATETRFVAWMDADFSHPPEVLMRLFEEASKTGCSVATRYLKDERSNFSLSSGHSDTLLGSVLSLVLNYLIYQILRISVTDYTSGFIVCRTDWLKGHRLIGDYGEYFIEVVYYLSRKSVQIPEVHYKSPPRQWGESKTGTTLFKLVRRGVKYLWMVFRLMLPKKYFKNVGLAVPLGNPN